MSEAPRRKPRFNHVAMTVPAELLNEANRAEILDFYGEVFGWTEMPTLTEDGTRLVLRAYDNEQFVFLVSGKQAMRAGAMDHFGLSVASPEELDAMYERALKYQERDERVEIVPREVEDFKVVKLHNFYVRFRIPLMVEIQCYEWAGTANADSLPA